MSDEIKVNSELPQKLATLGQVKDALDKRDEKIDSLKEDIGDYYPKKQGAIKCVNMVSNLPDEVIMPSGIEKIFWMVYVLSMVHLQLIIRISLSKNLY